MITWFCSPLCRTRVGQHLVLLPNRHGRCAFEGREPKMENQNYVKNQAPSEKHLQVSKTLQVEPCSPRPSKTPPISCGGGDQKSSKKSYPSSYHFQRQGQPRPCAAWNSVLPSTASDAVSTSAGLHWKDTRKDVGKRNGRSEKCKLNLTGGCHEK